MSDTNQGKADPPIRRRRGRSVGLAEDSPEEWIDAVRNAKMPDELDPDLRLARAGMTTE
jgi:hypothetical protein